MEKGRLNEKFKKKAIQAISTLPENTEIDDMMYRLYIIDQVEKGREDIKKGDLSTIDELEKEIEKW